MKRLGLVSHTSYCRIWKVEKEDRKFKASLGQTVNKEPTWAKGGPNFKIATHTPDFVYFISSIWCTIYQNGVVM